MSIVKVAALAGVSKSTVSMVINNNPTVVPSTVAKVRQAMEELGYEPGPREFRRGPKPNSMYKERVLTIALVTLGIPREVLGAPLYSDVLHGIANSIRQHSHRLTIYHLHEPEEFDSETVFRSKADGFLLFGKGESRSSAQALREYPCVSLMGTDKVRPWCDWVSYDDIAAGNLAAAYLIEQGHKVCAFIGDEGWRRGKAFVEHIRAAGGQVSTLDAANVIRIQDDAHQVDQEAVDLLIDQLTKLSPRPTGMFVFADMVTAALYPSLYQRGFEPGRDLSIVSCNNEWPLLLGLRPKPAVVDIQGVKIGRRAVEQLLWRMQNRREPTVTFLHTPTLVLPGQGNQ